jgi:hypothetical protein
VIILKLKRRIKMKEIMMTFIGITIAVLLVATVVLPQAFTPTGVHEAAKATGVGSASNINSSNTAKHMNFTTANRYDTGGGSITFTYVKDGAASINVTTPDDGTLITTFDGTSPDTITMSAANLAKSCSGNSCKVNFTSVSLGWSNVTAGTLNYQKTTTSVQDGWDTGTVAMWSIIGIAIVAALLLMIFRG